ncbi:MAG: amidohydrolase family protein, partial [Treponema sp.]|nr:amidohydrolase family protein [Treponema sp.]
MSAVCLHNGIVMTSFAAMDHCAVLVENGLIADVFSEKRFAQKHFGSDVEIIDAQGAVIAPGFIDTHIHGFGGYGTDDCAPESIVEMSRLLCRYGVTAFNPTLYPIAGDAMVDAVRQIA